MTKPVTDFSVCALKRALKAAHSLQLAVSGYEIAKDGSIRVLTVPRRIENENLETPGAAA
jgi:hypothetical protein